jgi:HAD superfamily hydrolase (TIGR01450 family)
VKVAGLVDGYDLVIFDLDGVVYLGTEPVPGAAAAVARLHERGTATAYVTNNASRGPGEVASLLASVGVPADVAEVTTSAQAAAAVLAERLGGGSPVLVVGAPALAAEVAGVGLRPVSAAGDGPRAVVQGYAPEVGWPQLAEATVAVRGGAFWLATNADRTLPSPRGPLPGNGSLVAALATALDRQPDLVVGKPAPTLFEQAARGNGARRPLVVGDRLDTDIEGARRAGMDSLLVLTGVSRPADLLAAGPQRRPTYVAADLGGLFRPVEARAGWRVRAVSGAVELDGDGDPVDALRALCEAVWSGDGADGVAVRPAGEAAERVLGELDLR